MLGFGFFGFGFFFLIGFTAVSKEMLVALSSLVSSLEMLVTSLKAAVVGFQLCI